MVAINKDMQPEVTSRHFKDQIRCFNICPSPWQSLIGQKVGRISGQKEKVKPRVSVVNGGKSRAVVEMHVIRKVN